MIGVAAPSQSEQLANTLQLSQSRGRKYRYKNNHLDAQKSYLAKSYLRVYIARLANVFTFDICGDKIWLPYLFVSLHSKEGRQVEHLSSCSPRAIEQ